MTESSPTEAPIPDTDGAILFLQRFYGKEPAILTAVHPSGGQGPDSITLDLQDPKQFQQARAWIDHRQGIWNIYFMVNPCLKALNHAAKAEKIDVRGALWLQADVDQRVGEEIEAEKKRALKLFKADKRPPTIIMDSGGGMQGFWKLTNEYITSGDLTKIEFVESRNRKIMLDYSGDHCFNIDRIMRVPGTINVPNSVKLRKGRVACASRLLEFNKNEYDINDFEGATGAPTSIGAATPIDAIPEHVELEALPGVNDLLIYVATYGKHPTEDNRWPSRSEMQFWWCGQMRLAGISSDVIASILLDKRYAISQGIFEKKDARVYAIRQVQRAELKFGLANKPIIEVRVDNIEEVLDKAEAAINNAGIEIFQAHGTLVRIVSRGDTDAPVIGEVKARWLLEKFINSAKWVKRLGKEAKSFTPENSYAEHYIEREGEWRVPYLNGIVSTPTLRSDFSLLNEPGYDKQSKLFYIPGATQFPAVPTNPTKADAEAALNALIYPIRCFPFVPDGAPDNWSPSPEEGLNPSASRSVILSAFITGVIRASLLTAPLHATDAPTAGSGKSKLADCVSILVTGLPAVMMSMGNDEAEDRKRLFSILAAGCRVIVIDNVARALEGDALCTILTQPVWQDRILGKSKMEAVSTNSLFMATGNNIFFKKDMSRRVVISRIDARAEKPDQRVFNFDPCDLILANRPNLVIGCLTIILAYIAAGRPCKDTIPPMGSFEQWSIVREALVWLGQPDPVLTRKSVQEDDPNRSTHAEVSELWWQVYRDGDQRLLSVFSEMQDPSMTDQYKIHLRDLFTSVSSNNRLAVKSMQWWFKNNSGQIINGRRFKYWSDPKHGMMTRLESDVQDEPEQEQEWQG